MFASLSSFLPSAFQQVVQTPSCPSDFSTPSPPLARPDEPVNHDPPPKKERKEKEKHSNEAFIIVRPPPSKSVHPLSLQVQLVPPQSRHDRPVQALDPSPDDHSTDLKRTHSIRSEASSASGYTSAGSVSSFASTSTSSSGRRTIIPLYNLNPHAVMQTTISDAGTDAKVAKFARRGLEVIGLAFLEPVEIRPSVPAHTSTMVPSIRVSLDDSLNEFGATRIPRSPSPNRPHTSHSMIHTDAFKPTIIAPPLAPPDHPPQRSTKKLFTRVFKKKDSVSPLAIAVPLPDDNPPQPSPLRNSTYRSDEAPVSLPDTPSQNDAWTSTLPSGTVSQSAILGIHPTLYPPGVKGRPTKYIWVVRKWLKGTDTGILNGVMGKLSTGARDTSATIPHIEVRFEWSREPKKGSVRKSRVDKGLNSRDTRSPVPHSTSSAMPRYASQTLSPDIRVHRCSIASHHSSGSDTGGSLASCSMHPPPEEMDDESDPEDSETPWTCTVVVQRVRQPLQHPHNGHGRESIIRLKVATLAPTPHHPKVVGLLKIPFPLPDIEVEHLTVRRRHVTSQGISKTTSPKAGELTLTAEEIKDTVSSTTLWLVVREAFGGVGRERKKDKS